MLTEVTPGRKHDNPTTTSSQVEGALRSTDKYSAGSPPYQRPRAASNPDAPHSTQRTSLSSGIAAVRPRAMSTPASECSSHRQPSAWLPRADQSIETPFGVLGRIAAALSLQDNVKAHARQRPPPISLQAGADSHRVIESRRPPLMQRKEATELTPACHRALPPRFDTAFPQPGAAA